jgi:hypothetical protein
MTKSLWGWDFERSHSSFQEFVLHLNEKIIFYHLGFINKSLPFLDTLLDNSNLKPVGKRSANSMQILLNHTVHKSFLMLE